MIVLSLDRQYPYSAWVWDARVRPDPPATGVWRRRGYIYVFDLVWGKP